MRRISTVLGVLAAASASLTAGCVTVEEIEDVSYDDRHGAATTLDLFLPPDGDGPRPAVLLIHGGGWRGGDKGHFTEMGRRLAASGVVAVSMNYRLAPEHTYPAQVQDCFCALSWLRAHAGEVGVDPDRIAVMGYSAGGHLVGMLGLAASIPSLQDDCPWGPTGAPDAVIMGAGPSDLRGRDHWVIEDFLGGSEEDLPQLYVEASPMAHVGPGAPPFLFVHATQDWFVSIDDSIALRDALRAEGNDARLLELVGGGHLLNEGVDLGHWYGRMSLESPEAWLVIDDFLDRTIGAEGR